MVARWMDGTVGLEAPTEGACRGAGGAVGVVVGGWVGGWVGGGQWWEGGRVVWAGLITRRPICAFSQRRWGECRRPAESSLTRGGAPPRVVTLQGSRAGRRPQRHGLAKRPGRSCTGRDGGGSGQRARARAAQGCVVWPRGPTNAPTHSPAAVPSGSTPGSGSRRWAGARCSARRASRPPRPRR